MDTERDQEATLEDGATPDSAPTSAGWLQTGPGRGALAARAEVSRGWLFPESDELFRTIYTRAGTGFTHEVIAVCSAVAGEGKTTLSVGLATSIAEDFPERRVLLVETDLQRPILAEDFDIDASPGLVDCLVSGEPLLTVCRPTLLENLHVVPAGVAGALSGRPLRSSRMAAIVEAMRESYDLIILDLPAILSNSDAVLLTDLVDGVICVVRAGVTPAVLVNRALEQIEEGKLRGVVLNGNDTAVPGWLSRLVGL